MECSFAAQRIWHAIAPDGGEHTLTLTVSVPEQESEFGGWLAHLSITPIDEKTWTIYGADSWQAITLTMKFAISRLRCAAKDGWRFFWERDDDEEADPGDLLRVGP